MPAELKRAELLRGEERLHIQYLRLVITEVEYFNNTSAKRRDLCYILLLLTWKQRKTGKGVFRSKAWVRSSAVESGLFPSRQPCLKIDSIPRPVIPKRD